MVSDAAVSHVFDGLGGDVLSAGLFQEDALARLYEEGSFVQLAERVFDYWSRLGGESGLDVPTMLHLTDQVERSAATQLLAAQLECHAEQPNPLKAFYFWNRTRRGTGLLPFVLFRSLTGLTPYLDTDLVTFLLRLPHELTRDKTFHTAAILRADRSIGTIEYESKTQYSRALSPGYWGKMHLTLALQAAKRGDITLAKRSFGAVFSTTQGQMPWWNPRRAIYALELDRFLNELPNAESRSRHADKFIGG